MQLAKLLAVAAATVTPAAAAAQMSPSIQQDVRCFFLFAAAVDEAGKANNDKGREASSLGVMYYYGKLKVGAPSLDLVAAVRQEIAAMEGNPRAREIGEACDAEFARRGQELIDFGQELQAAEAQSSSSS